MDTKTVAGPSGENITVVKLAFTERWLQEATTGHSKHSGKAFGRMSLLEDLRVMIQQVCDGEEHNASSAVAETADYDPMAEVE